MFEWLQKLKNAFTPQAPLTSEEHSLREQERLFDETLAYLKAHKAKRDGRLYVLALDKLIDRTGGGFKPSQLHRHPQIMLVEERDLFGPMHSSYEHLTPDQERLVQRLIQEFPFDLIVIGNNAGKGIQRTYAVVQVLEDPALTHKPEVLVVWNGVIRESETPFYDSETVPLRFIIRDELDATAYQLFGLEPPSLTDVD